MYLGRWTVLSLYCFSQQQDSHMLVSVQSFNSYWSCCLWLALCMKVSLGICWRPGQRVRWFGQTSTVAWPCTYICAACASYCPPTLCSS